MFLKVAGDGEGLGHGWQPSRRAGS
jgi:hypothetical protein